jgi:signal transduction histidine kinase
MEVNPAFEREVGLKADAVLGNTLKTLFPNLEPVWWEALVRTADQGVGASLQHYAVDVDRYFDVNIHQLDDGTVALLALDITERERLEQEKVRSQRLESLGLLAGGIAHDFNNILTAILGNLSLLRLRLGEAGEERGRLVVDAEKAALRARDLTRQLLTFSRGGAPVKKRVDLRALVRDVAEFVLHGSPVRLELALPDQPLAAELDPGQIGQVIQNLVINADQAMPGGGTLRIRGERMMLEPQDPPTMLAPGPYIRLTVADEGAGIAPEVRDRIFDPYFTTKEQGSGLGLTTSYSIVRRHGGHLDVHSISGQGATFTVLLPAAEQVDEPEHTAAPVSPSGSGRVLVMDDEVMILTLTRAILGHMGYQVAVAEHGEAAIRAYEEAMAGGARFDAVILDLTIPGGLGGLETIARLRALDPTVRAIVSSGYSEDPVMAHYAAYGFAGVAMKPYTAEYLGDVLARVLARERPADGGQGGAA